MASDQNASRLEDEIKFWVRLSSDLMGESDALPPPRALLALSDALERYLTHETDQRAPLPISP